MNYELQKFFLLMESKKLLFHVESFTYFLQFKFHYSNKKQTNGD